MQYFKRKIASIVSKSVEWQYKENLKKKLSNSNIKLGQYVMFDQNCDIELPESNFKLEIGTRVIFKKYCGIVMLAKSELIIEDNVFFNKQCSINCLGKISIGEGSIFGEGVKLYDHNHKSDRINGELKVERHEYSVGSIAIGRNCWIGSNVTILKNVIIGDNVIVGANCLIYKSIPENSIVRHSEQLLIN